jgi:hypothetical protein
MSPDPFYLEQLRRRLAQRSAYNTDGCRIWQGSLTTTGYGQVSVTMNGRKRPEKAHRASWLAHHGPIPEGLCVCHKCDDALCIHEDHLFLGTKAENSADMVAKGRSARGARNGSAVLTELDVRDIRRLLSFGTRQTEIAEAYGVCRPLISMIKNGRAWAQFNTGDTHRN